MKHVNLKIKLMSLSSKKSMNNSKQNMNKVLDIDLSLHMLVVGVVGL